MITIRDIDRTDVCGYLGNRLFMIAAAYNLAKQNNDELVLPHFEFEDVFEEKLFRVVDKSELKIEHEYSEPFFHYQKIPYQNNLNLNGYFQSWKYFKEVQDQIRFKDDIHVRVMENKVPGYECDWCDLTAPSHVHGPDGYITCSIHVRRADYLNLSQHHPVLTMDYYNKAMEMFPEVDFFVICSNDIEWCKSQFKGKKFIFSDSKQEKPLGNSSSIFDMILMSHCKYNIIANSSYSWWAAMMNYNVGKKVVCPAKWFGPALSHHNTDDLYPEGWIKI